MLGDGNAAGKVELKRLLMEGPRAVMLHLSEELIFFHGAIIGGASRQHAGVAFPCMPLSLPVIVIFCR
jgi:hypothetical protein